MPGECTMTPPRLTIPTDSDGCHGRFRAGRCVGREGGGGGGGGGGRGQLFFCRQCPLRGPNISD